MVQVLDSNAVLGRLHPRDLLELIACERALRNRWTPERECAAVPVQEHEAPN